MSCFVGFSSTLNELIAVFLNISERASICFFFTAGFFIRMALVDNRVRPLCWGTLLLLLLSFIWAVLSNKRCFGWSGKLWISLNVGPLAYFPCACASPTIRISRLVRNERFISFCRVNRGLSVWEKLFYTRLTPLYPSLYCMNCITDLAIITINWVC